MACADCGAEWRPRDEIGGYVLGELLARGGFSQIFHALDPVSGASLAVKILSPPDGFTREDAVCFTTSAQFLTMHEHPNWLRIYGGGMEDDVAWLAMEWMPEPSLAQRRRQGESEAANAAWQIAAGLAAAHANGMTHRNLQIGECFVDDRGAVKVAGFAEAIFYERAGREVGTAWGRLSCAPPERLFDEPEDVRSEIYALGVVLFQMLTGELPFDGETVPELFVERLDDPAPRIGETLHGVQKSTAAIVERMLAVDPAQRFSTWEETMEILRDRIEVLGGSGSPAVPRAVAVRVTHRVVKPPVYSAAEGAWFTILMVAGIAGFLGWYGWKHFHETTTETSAVADAGVPAAAPILTTPPDATALAETPPRSPPPPVPPNPVARSMDWSAWKVNFLESPKRPGTGKGEANFSGGSGALHLSGNNSGMSGGNDECVFYAREITGDWTFTVRVGAANGPAGIAAREGMGSDRPCVGIFLGPDGRLNSALRSQSAARLVPAPVAGGAGSKWLRLARRGAAISAFHSANGKHWRESATLNLTTPPARVPVGFSVWSGVTEKLAGAIFEDVALKIEN